MLTAEPDAGGSQFQFTAVKEEDAWKIVPPRTYDAAITMHLLRRFTEAKEAPIASLQAGKISDRSAARKAFLESLQETGGEGTPEGAIARFRTARLAMDIDAMLASLEEKSRSKLAAKLEQDRQRHASYRAFQEAVEDRFGPHPNASQSREQYDGGRNCLGIGTVDLEIVSKQPASDKEVRFELIQTYDSNYRAAIEKITLTAHKHDGLWRLGLSSADWLLEPIPAFMLADIAANERIVAELTAGKFRSSAEASARYRQIVEEIKSSPSEAK